MKLRVFDKTEKKMIPVLALFIDENMIKVSDNENDIFNYNNEYYSDIMQDTGLKDSKGNAIYEGDLLDFDEKEWGDKFTPEIMDLKNMIGNWEYCGSFSDIRDWRTVIGNIHENADILN